MKQISKGRVIRCTAVIFANNAQGVDIGSQLISNMLDLDRAESYRLLKDAMYAKEAHKKLGGSLKDFENGKILKNEV